MSNFTYIIPDAAIYLKTLIEYLNAIKKFKIANMLKNSKCELTSSGNFSDIRWNAYSMLIYFRIPVKYLQQFNNKSTKEELFPHCKEIFPQDSGYDITEIHFSPKLIDEKNKEKLSEELDKLIETLSTEIRTEILPDDIIKKGKNMAQTYFYLYCVENSLRLFIENVAKKKLGDLENLQIGKKLKDNIQNRKENERNKKWLPIRGDSDLFYLDFGDLSKILQNNQDIFSSFFPNVSWITTKIQELSELRNFVAHNSYIDETQKQMIKIYYENIMKQIDENFSTI